MGVLVRGCLESDFDAVTGTCTTEIWVPQSSVIPVLTIEEAQQIGAAAAYVLAVAFLFRLIRKQLWQS